MLVIKKGLQNPKDMLDFKKNGVIVKKKGMILLCGLILSIGISNASESVSLFQCRKQALKNNKNIQIAQESKSMAMNNRKASFTYFMPTVNLMADYTRLEKQIKYDLDLKLKEKMTAFLTGMAQANPVVTTDPFFQTLQQMGSALPSKISLSMGEKNNYVGSLSLTQPLFTGGKIVQQYKISKYLEDIAEEQCKMSEEEVIEKTDEYYYKLVTVKEKMKLASKYLEMIQSHLSDLNNMKEAGLITDNEVLKAKVKLNEAELNLYKAQNGCSLARMALNQIIGNPVYTDIEPTDSLVVRRDIKETDTNKAIENRSEIKLLENSMKISNSLVNVSRSSYMPNILLQGNYTFLNPNPYNSFETEFGSSWQLSVVGQWQIFHGNERYYRLAEAKHALRTTQLKIEDTRELINLDVEQNRLKLSEALKRIDMSETGVQQAEDNLRVCNDKFKEGMLSASEVLDAQTLWTQAVSNKIEAVSDYNLSITKYYKALGLLNESNLGE